MARKAPSASSMSFAKGLSNAQSKGSAKPPAGGRMPPAKGKGKGKSLPPWMKPK